MVWASLDKHTSIIDNYASTIDKGPTDMSAARLIVIGCLLAGAFHGTSRQIRDLDGQSMSLFTAAKNAAVLFFVTSDCPISNGYAPAIQQICRDRRARGVDCALVYEDAEIAPAGVRRHLEEFGYRGIPATIDRDRTIADRVRATVTPQAVVVDATGELRYRGRIDNRYADLGMPRRVVTIHDLQNALDAVIDGRPVEHPETPALGCFIAGRKADSRD
jgi:AhpC/TSA family